MQNGFIDLRQNDGRLVDDSFWPSFTDVMTVIVMIFLIATTVLIVKNWELVRELEQRILSEKEISTALKATIIDKNKTHKELLASMAAKEQISRELDASIEALQKTSTIAEQNQAENITLEERLQHAESTLELLKLQLLQTQKKLAYSQIKINNKKHTIKEKLQLINQLDKQLKKSQNTNASKTQTIENHIIVLNRLADLLDKSRSKTAQVQQQLEHSNTDIAQLNQQLTKAEQQNSLQNKQLKKEQLAVKNRESKYNELMDRLVKIELKLKDTESLFIQAQKTINLKQQGITEKEKQIVKLNSLSQSLALDIEAQTKANQAQAEQLASLNQQNLDKQKQIAILNKLSQSQLVDLETQTKSNQEQAEQLVNLSQQNLDKQKQIAILNKLSQSQLVDLDAQTKSNQELAEQLVSLNQINLDKELQLEELNKQISLAQELQKDQGKKYDELEDKYKKLVRPARSALGKYVVEVRYEKKNGKESILYKDASESKFTELNLAQVNKKLAVLKKQYAQRLYVKVIIPDNSGLSYKEAWTFMQDIFNKYDYYYQQ